MVPVWSQPLNAWNPFNDPLQRCKEDQVELIDAWLLCQLLGKFLRRDSIVCFQKARTNTSVSGLWIQRDAAPLSVASMACRIMRVSASFWVVFIWSTDKLLDLHSLDLLSIISRKWLARSRPLRTHVGFPIDWTTAIPSMITTLLPVCWCCRALIGGEFSRTLISLLLPTQSRKSPSELNSALGNAANSNSQMLSLRLISGLKRTTTRKRANKALSSFRATTPDHGLLFFFSVVVFQVWRLAFFIGLQTLGLRSTILSFTKLLKRTSRA